MTKMPSQSELSPWTIPVHLEFVFSVFTEQHQLSHLSLLEVLLMEAGEAGLVAASTVYLLTFC